MKSATVERLITPTLSADAMAKLTDMQCRIVGSPIAPAPRNPIAQRAMAARSTANQIHIDAMLVVMEETVRLAHEGHAIAGLEIHDGRPVIELVPSALLTHLAETETGATYVGHGNTNGIRKRTGELLRRTCRVFWLEKGI